MKKLSVYFLFACLSLFSFLNILFTLFPNDIYNITFFVNAKQQLNIENSNTFREEDKEKQNEIIKESEKQKLKTEKIVKQEEEEKHFLPLFQKLDMYDSVHTYALEKLAFGSCSKQYIQNKIWEEIAKKKPQGWIWMGDAIYPECDEFKCIVEGYKKINTNLSYKNMIDNLIFLDGVWDDHDYGENDGGKFYKDKEKSKGEFLKFIKVKENSTKGNLRYKRNGGYSSHIFGLDELTYKKYMFFKKESKNIKEGEANDIDEEYGKEVFLTKQSNHSHNIRKKVKLIILDTRYNRDDYYIRSLASIHSFFSIPAALVRFFTSFFGFDKDFDGDILGEEQWKWLDQILDEENEIVVDDNNEKNKTILHIFVSSVQMTTSFPFVESWGHFSKCRKRFFEILKKKKIKNFLILSGDVHFAQTFQLNEKASDFNAIENNEEIVKGMEITSSGLTHSICHFPLFFFCFDFIFKIFEKNKDKIKTEYYLRENFGLLNFDYQKEYVELKGEIYDLYGKVQLSALQKYIYAKEETNPEEKILKYEFLDNISDLKSLSVYNVSIILGFLLFWFLQIIYLLFFNKKKSRNEGKKME